MNEPREEMTDQKLEQILRSLPREQAGADFTAGVMARLARPSTQSGPGAALLPFPGERRRLPAWSGWLMAAAALLVCGLGLREWQHRREVEESMQRIAELRGQYQELASELDDLRREAASARPVFYVGGNQQVDLVVDLARLAEARKDPKKPDPEARRQAKEELERLYKEGGSAPLY